MAQATEPSGFRHRGQPEKPGMYPSLANKTQDGGKETPVLWSSWLLGYETRAAGDHDSSLVRQVACKCGVRGKQR
jgi:hypothetical protein